MTERDIFQAKVESSGDDQQHDGPKIATGRGGPKPKAYEFKIAPESDEALQAMARITAHAKEMGVRAIPEEFKARINEGRDR